MSKKHLVPWAATAYFAVIFALGFALGTLRVLWGAQALGETRFVLVEVPLMLAASWFAARWLTHRYRIRQGGRALAMGMAAFGLLMVAEIALAAVTGEGAIGWLASLARPPALYGFLGQIGFALMPWLVARSRGPAGR